MYFLYNIMRKLHYFYYFMQQTIKIVNLSSVFLQFLVYQVLNRKSPHRCPIRHPVRNFSYFLYSSLQLFQDHHRIWSQCQRLTVKAACLICCRLIYTLCKFTIIRICSDFLYLLFSCQINNHQHTLILCHTNIRNQLLDRKSVV